MNRGQDLASYSTILKLRKIVLNIKSSSIRTAKFKNLCETQGKKFYKISADVDTRWGSAYRMVNKSLVLKNQINHMVQEDRDMEPHRLSMDDWDILSTLSDNLKIFHEFSTFFEGQRYPTISQSIASFNILFDKLDDLDDKYPNNQGVKDAFKKLKKFYKLSDNCPAHYIALILNPSFKVNYLVTHGWEVNSVRQIKQL